MEHHQTHAPKTTLSSFFPRGYENPEDFSLDASGCFFCRGATSVVGPSSSSSSSSFPDDDDDDDDDDDAIFGEI